MEMRSHVGHRTYMLLREASEMILEKRQGDGDSPLVYANLVFFTTLLISSKNDSHKNLGLRSPVTVTQVPGRTP